MSEVLLRGPGRRAVWVGVIAVLATTACSALVSTTGLTGGATDGGALGPDSGTEAPLPDSGAQTNDAGIDDDAAPSTGTDAGADGATFDAGGSPSDGSSGLPVPDAGAGCTQDLSNIGTGDFHVSFVLTTTQSGTVALVNQRSTCVPATFWDLRLVNGGLMLETDDVSNYSNISTTGPDLDDGAPHSVLVARVSGTVTITVDDSSEGSGGSGASFGSLAPLQSGVDACDGQDQTVPLSGTLANLCVAAH